VCRSTPSCRASARYEPPAFRSSSADDATFGDRLDLAAPPTAGFALRVYSVAPLPATIGPTRDGRVRNGSPWHRFLLIANETGRGPHDGSDEMGHAATMFSFVGIGSCVLSRLTGTRSKAAQRHCHRRWRPRVRRSTASRTRGAHPGACHRTQPGHRLARGKGNGFPAPPICLHKLGRFGRTTVELRGIDEDVERASYQQLARNARVLATFEAAIG
jgi:hypothetical protein